MLSARTPQQGVWFQVTWPSPYRTFSPSRSWLALLAFFRTERGEVGVAERTSLYGGLAPGLRSAATAKSAASRPVHLYPAAAAAGLGYMFAKLYPRLLRKSVKLARD